jgi:hypothetical protein
MFFKTLPKTGTVGSYKSPTLVQRGFFLGKNGPKSPHHKVKKI